MHTCTDGVGWPRSMTMIITLPCRMHIDCELAPHFNVDYALAYA